jgi:S-adenosylmethionine hydrolase
VGDRIEGRIVYVDVYGNLFTNIRAADLEQDHGVPPADRRLTIQAGDDTRPVTLTGLSSTFGEVEVGQPLFYLGSSGYLEIAVNRGRADDFFQARTGFSVFLENKSGSGRP